MILFRESEQLGVTEIEDSVLNLQIQWNFDVFHIRYPSNQLCLRFLDRRHNAIECNIIFLPFC